MKPRKASEFDRTVITMPFSEYTQDFQQAINSFAHEQEIEDIPKVVYKRHKNLQDLLIHSKIEHKTMKFD